MTNYYICDYGNCGASRPNNEMFYLRVPFHLDFRRRTIKRFCTKAHMIAWLLAEKTGNVAHDAEVKVWFSKYAEAPK